jgi:hypothetical protein
MGRISGSSLAWNEATIGKERNIDEGNGTRMETECNGQFTTESVTDPLTTIRTLWQYSSFTAATLAPEYIAQPVGSPLYEGQVTPLVLVIIVSYYI